MERNAQNTAVLPALGHVCPRHFGLNYGILYTAWGISGAIGPVIASAVADATGTFVMAYMISAGLLALALGLNLVLKPLNSKKESLQEKAASA